MPYDGQFRAVSAALASCATERIVTHGDGAVGIQISRPVGQIKVRRGIATYGGTGDSLVKGVIKKLSAIALSIKPGGSARDIDVAGGLIAYGQSTTPSELHGSMASYVTAASSQTRPA